MEFYKTSMGRKYYEVDVPKIIDALLRIANALDEQNSAAKQKLKEDKKLLKEIEKKINQSTKVAASEE